MFYVETRIGYQEFETYEGAELYCILNGIHCENIEEE